MSLYCLSILSFTCLEIPYLLLILGFSICLDALCFVTESNPLYFITTTQLSPFSMLDHLSLHSTSTYNILSTTTFGICLMACGTSSFKPYMKITSHLDEYDKRALRREGQNNLKKHEGH